jgi:hypothetical protein
MSAHHYFYGAYLFFLLLGIILLFLLRKFTPHPLKEHQQQVLIGPLSFFFAIYAFFLSFSIITLWQTYNDIQSSVNKEANSLIVSFHLSYRIDGSEVFRNTVKAYARSVIDEEWETMKVGKISKNAAALHDEIWTKAMWLRPVTPPEQQVYKAILESLKDFNERRAERILSIGGSLIPPMWVILAIGGVCSIVALYYLSLPHNSIQTIIDTILIGIIILGLFLIGELNKPFQGYITITDKAFTAISIRMEMLDKEMGQYPVHR